MHSTTEAAAREIRDVYGRRRRIGEGAEDLLGHSRRWQLVACVACMAAISPLQYAFGVAALRLEQAHGWAFSATMSLLAVFIVCQALVAIPAAWLQRRRTLTPTRSILVGGALAAGGLAALAHAENLLLAVLGYALCGGVGAGLVYSQCVTTSGRWFPDRRSTAIGVVTAGFACGALPWVVLLSATSSPQAYTLVLDVAALTAVVVALLAAVEVKEPPVNWWPPEVDAQRWAVDRALNPSLPRNMPAVRYYGPRDAVRTGMLPLMWAMLAVISMVSLFGIAFVASYAVTVGLGMGVAGAAAALVAAVNGLGRVVGGRLSDRFGRRSALVAILLVEGLAQLGLSGFAPLGNRAVFLWCAAFVGLGGGAFYTVFANLVLEYFGENSVLQNQSVLYTAKAVGGMVGVGAAAFLVVQLGHRPLFLSAGLLALAAALLVRFLKQPGRPALPPPDRRGPSPRAWAKQT
jgi:MFS family permease